MENKVLLGVEEGIYCSLQPKSNDEKKALFNALENCDALLNDSVGTEIELKHIYIETHFHEENGKTKTSYRIILFDANGTTYASGSYGVFNVLRNIIKIYDLPETWNEPIKVKVVKKPVSQGKSTLSLVLI